MAVDRESRSCCVRVSGDCHLFPGNLQVMSGPAMFHHQQTSLPSRTKRHNHPTHETSRRGLHADPFHGRLVGECHTGEKEMRAQYDHFCLSNVYTIARHITSINWFPRGEPTCTTKSTLHSFITIDASSPTSFKGDWVCSLLGKEKMNAGGSASSCFIKMLYTCDPVFFSLKGHDIGLCQGHNRMRYSLEFLDCGQPKRHLKPVINCFLPTCSSSSPPMRMCMV